MSNTQNVANSMQPDQLEDGDIRAPHISRQLDDKPNKGFSNFKKEKEKEKEKEREREKEQKQNVSVNSQNIHINNLENDSN